MALVRAHLAAILIIGMLFSMAVLYEGPLFSISKTKMIMINNHIMDDINGEHYSLTERSESRGRNIVFIFAGRWKFLRIQFMYLFRDLRKNGGIVDKVLYMMLNYDQETHSKLIELTKVANSILGEEIFELRYMGYTPGHLPWNPYPKAYYDLFPEIIHNRPLDTYFKMDDDIVYIHPGALEMMIMNKNSSDCFMHFGNIVTNWRCSITHQRMGLFNSTTLNPKQHRFEYHPNGNCGWKSPECAELALKAFLHYYRQQQLEKYTFPGRELLLDRRRFSINFFMLDKDLIDVQAIRKAGPISSDDEGWWTMKFAPLLKQPNCIVGKALVVHFSYYTTINEMLNRGFLQEFETIAWNEAGSKMPLDFKHIIHNSKSANSD